MTVFAEVDSSLQQIGGECPEGWVVMQGERPTINHTADSEGNWIIRQLTEEELKALEIAQDKQYLADTDYIVTKIGEASLLGQDISELLARYSADLERRELARIRIRIAESRLE